MVQNCRHSLAMEGLQTSSNQKPWDDSMLDEEIYTSQLRTMPTMGMQSRWTQPFAMGILDTYFPIFAWLYTSLEPTMAIVAKHICFSTIGGVQGIFTMRSYKSYFLGYPEMSCRLVAIVSKRIQHIHCDTMSYVTITSYNINTQIIHVFYIYLHLGHLWGKCR